MRILLYGATGWIGGMFKQLCEDQGVDVRAGRARIESRRDVVLDIERHQPTHVVSAAGATGVPSIDWCEDHKADTIRSNVIGQLNLADVCHERGLHLTYFGTGCIYSAANRATGTATTPFREDDRPCPPDSFYLTTKAMVDDCMLHYPNVLTLRVRMPMSGDVLCPRNLVHKLLKYKKVGEMERGGQGGGTTHRFPFWGVAAHQTRPLCTSSSPPLRSSAFPTRSPSCPNCCP